MATAVKCTVSREIEIGRFLDFVAVQKCGSESLCDRERGCQLPVCDVGETRCRDGVRELCASDRTRWQTLGVCSDRTSSAGGEAGLSDQRQG
jgi:hypothetical protein